MQQVSEHQQAKGSSSVLRPLYDAYSAATSTSTAISPLDLQLLAPEQLPPIYQHLLLEPTLMTPALQRHHHSSTLKLVVHHVQHLGDSATAADNDVDALPTQLRRIITLHAQPTATTMASTPLHAPDSCPFAKQRDTCCLNDGLCMCFTPCKCHGYAGAIELGVLTIHINNLPTLGLQQAAVQGLKPFGQLLQEASVPVVNEVQCVLQCHLPADDAFFQPILAQPIQHLQRNNSKSAVNPLPSYTLYGRCNQLRIAGSDTVLADVVEVLPPIHEGLGQSYKCG